MSKLICKLTKFSFIKLFTLIFLVISFSLGLFTLPSIAKPFQLKDDQYEIMAENSESIPGKIILTKVDLSTGKGVERYRIKAEELIISTNATGGFNGMEANISFMESNEFTMTADQLIFTADSTGELNNFKAIGEVKMIAKENANWNGLKEINSPEISFQFASSKNTKPEQNPNTSKNILKRN